MIADPVAALVSLLLADPKISAEVGNRAWGIEMPREEARNQPSKGLVVQPAGGTASVGGYLAHTTMRLDVLAFGATPHEAYVLSCLVRGVLRGARRQVVTVEGAPVLLHWLEEAGGQTSGRDPQTQWPVVTQAFQIFYAIESAA
jgi:hypothetical protein